MKKLLLALLLVLFYSFSYTQNVTKNLVIVTLDGMRWQEVFGGVDSTILHDSKFTSDSTRLISNFWDKDILERRKKLFPFLWGTVALKGQLYGNRALGDLVNTANQYWFSYPGYNELFTGFPDSMVNSNDKIPNKNINVLEFINHQKDFQGKVAVFATWDCFPYIFNKWRSGIIVNADTDSINFQNQNLRLINEMQFLTAKPLDERPDMLTYFAGREYLKEFHPKVLYIAFDETDDMAHAGLYDQYIKSAHAEDAMIADLWKTIQFMPEYQGNTTLIITCDHGRGDQNKDQWTSHGSDIPGSNQIWIAVIGPDSKPMGEVRGPSQLYQGQMASTFAELLGFQFNPDHPVMEPVYTILSKK